MRKLLANERNEVWILSGMGVQGGLEKIAAELPGVGLVYAAYTLPTELTPTDFAFRAENGCMIKPIGQTEWVNLVPDFNLDWKAPALEILTYVSAFTSKYDSGNPAYAKLVYRPYSRNLHREPWSICLLEIWERAA